MMKAIMKTAAATACRRGALFLSLQTLACTAIVVGVAANDGNCFQPQYVLNESFPASSAGDPGALKFDFQNVSDVVINERDRHVLVLQRYYPPVSVWSLENGTLLFAWTTREVGYPHLMTLNQTTAETTVWIADMAGVLAAGKEYGHCVKHFTYTGEYIGSIGKCGENSQGSGLNPVQFDRVTDLAINSKGHIYVTDGDVGGENNRILVFDSNYNLVNVWNKNNTMGSGPLQFNLPHAISVDGCDRIWVVDTQNHRIQIISSSGEFLKEWKCFNDSLIYGMDISLKLGFVVVTVKKAYNNESEILFLPLQSADDCSSNAIANCTVYRRMVIRQDSVLKRGHMIDLHTTTLHSVAVDSITKSLYVSVLPGAIPPLKFSPVPLPPSRKKDACTANNPRVIWPDVWNATLLLTPYGAEDLHTAIVEFRDDIHAMRVRVYGSNGKLIWDFLNVKNQTYNLIGNSTVFTCSPWPFGSWTTPDRDLFTRYDKCECVGGQNVSEINVIAWSCTKYKLRDWYWVHANNESTWRIFFNNKTNPINLPVIGNYTMAHFSSYGKEVNGLNAAYELCITGGKKQFLETSNPLSLKACPSDFSFPDWPMFFHMTVTMVPVTLNNGEPLPTQVVYDWSRESQHTIMCEPSQTYNAYMVHNKTYIYYEDLATKSVKCNSNPLPFGPPKPNWMTQDKCTCKGIIENNPSLSPYANAVIAVCPVSEGRVFWTWFVHNGTEFLPLLFFETETPPQEGTGLALADYHAIYQGVIMIDLADFTFASKCAKNNIYTAFSWHALP